jgi:hypothetical protein
VIITEDRVKIEEHSVIRIIRGPNGEAEKTGDGG